MQRAMARQAEAERERRAKVIHAEGERQAAAKLSDGRERDRARHPAALQLRYLQTLGEIGAEHNSTIVFPLPIDLVEPLLEAPPRRSRPKSRTQSAGELEDGGRGTERAAARRVRGRPA